MKRRVITVFGGSGFLGRHIVQRLANAGFGVRVGVRDTEDALYLKPLGEVGQIIPVPVNIMDASSLPAVLEGASGAINLVGILSEWGKQTFQNVHVEGAANIAKAASKAGVKSLVQVSALGADKASSSEYARTKAQGEDAVKAAFPKAVILRPSVVFGVEDNFFNMFASLAGFSPMLPVFGCPALPKVSFPGKDGLVDVDAYGDGGTKFQPVYVGDVADGVISVLFNNKAAGETYELGGPSVYSFKALMEFVLSQTKRQRLLLPVPFAMAHISAWFLEKWPSPLITRDQLRLLEADNVTGKDTLGFKDLGLAPRTVESVVPDYLR
jgi:uncharacterized protein YbjT (DUF2867 family)